MTVPDVEGGGFYAWVITDVDNVAQQTDVTNDKANARYYNGPVSPRAILTGQVMPPRGAAELRRVL